MEDQITLDEPQISEIVTIPADFNKWKTQIISDFISNFNDLNSASKPRCKGIYRNLNYWLDDNRDDFVLNKAALFGINSPEDIWLKEIEEPLVKKIESLDYLSLFKRAPYKFPKNLRDVLGEVEEFLDERDIYVQELNIDCKSNDYLMFKEWINEKKDYLTSHADWHLVEKSKEDIPSSLKSRFDVDNVFNSEYYCSETYMRNNGLMNSAALKGAQPVTFVNKDLSAILTKDFWANFPQSLIHSNKLITLGFIVFQIFLLVFVFKKIFPSDSSSGKKKGFFDDDDDDEEEYINLDSSIDPALLKKGNRSKNEYYAFYPVKPKKAKDSGSSDDQKEGESTSSSDNEDGVDKTKSENIPDQIDLDNLKKKNTYVFPNENNDGLIIIDVFVPLHNTGDVVELTKEEVLDVCKELFKNKIKNKVELTDDDKELVKNGKKYVVL
ncbi:STP1 protein [Plasmodium gonderi]|uniref:STP1 protein n=1 Tax=Plasmodium gonderi TaxID=77519 RepID=A0A1Y1JGI4_PLAGO|nr:STP1 protein [Plasmodium gonderi]GAW80445.1 STP1 protein [Plasmodium gonderi]